MTTTIVKWGQGRVKLTWAALDAVPDRSLVTSVHGLCFYEEKLMLVDLQKRGWDFPGGHIEKGESVEECFQREAMEEGYVTGRSEMIGYIEVDHNENELWEVNGKYPKVGYQLFYRMDIKTLHPFLAEHESKSRIFVSADEAAQLYKE